MEEPEVIAPEKGEEPVVEEEPTETPEETPGEEASTEEPVEEVAEAEPETPAEPTVAELAKRLEKAEKRTQYLQRKLERPGKNPEAPKPAQTRPDQDQFEDYDEYIDALTDWKADERDRVRAEKRVERQKAEKEEDFMAAIESGPEKYPDFEEVATKQPKDGGPTITQGMADVMMECDNAVDIAYYLGKNVGESLRISKMSPIQMAREIGRLEVTLTQPETKQTPPKKVDSKAPDPIKPVGDNEPTTPSLDNMSMEQSAAYWNKKDYGTANPSG